MTKHEIRNMIRTMTLTDNNEMHLHSETLRDVRNMFRDGLSFKALCDLGWEVHHAIYG